MTRPHTDPRRVAYERARRRALQRLSRERRDEYLALVEEELGRPLDRGQDRRRMRGRA